MNAAPGSTIAIDSLRKRATAAMALLMGMLSGIGIIPESLAQNTTPTSEVITLDIPDGAKAMPSISADGRFVAFRYVRYVNPADSRGDAYIHDRHTGTSHKITAGFDTASYPYYTADAPTISADGRFVVFSSTSMNMGVPTSGYGLFVYDRINNTIETVVTGKQGDILRSMPAISADGRHVIYWVVKRDPVTGATSFAIRLRDMVNKTTEDTGATALALAITGNLRYLNVSTDGRYISYSRRKPGGDRRTDDLLVHDRVTGTDELINVNNAGQRADGISVVSPTMSADGQLVTFASTAYNLTADDKNTNADVFVRDRAAGTTEKISYDSATEPASEPNMSADGRYVVFRGIGIPGGQPGTYVHDRITKKAERLPIGYGHVSMPVISDRDGTIAYANAGAGRVSPYSEIVVLDRGAPAGIVLSATGLSLTEGGGPGTYAIVLAKAPTADVKVTAFAGTQLSASPAVLTFSAANWSTPQTVTIYALQDGIPEGPHTGLITHTVESTDPQYQALPAASVNVTITDTVAPTLSLAIPTGDVWTQPDLPLRGTAAPGATVLIVASNTTTNAVFAVSVVADASGAWSRTLFGLTDGAYELQAEADAIKSNTVTVAIDSHAPVSTLGTSSSATLSAAGWYAAPVQLTISASDGGGGQGVARSEYTLNGSAYAAFPAAGLNLSAQGSHAVCYRSVDAANNIEAQRCVAIAIDSVAPQANPLFNTVNNTLGLNAQDSGSGIQIVEVSRDGGASWAVQDGPLSFTRDGSHTVHYRVADKAGNTISGQTTVSVITVPVVSAPAAQNGPEGGSASFALGSFTDQSGDSPWRIDIDWGDGSPIETISANAAGTLPPRPHTYSESGLYAVKLKVTDQAGSAGNATFNITADNVAPTADMTIGASVDEGGQLNAMLANPSDPSSGDTVAGLRYAFACDGASLAGATYASSSATPTIACVFPDSGARTVRARIYDRDNGFTEYTAPVTVNNLAPSATLAIGATLIEGTPADIFLNNATDASSADVAAGLHYAYACDGASLAGATYANSSANAAGSCTFSDNGNKNVLARVIDKDDGFTEYTAMVTVANAAPTAVLSAGATVVEGGSVVVVLTVPADPSSADTQAGLRYAVACNGSSLAGATYAGGSASATASCTYADGPLTQTIRTRIMDKDGGFTEYTASVGILNAVPVLSAVAGPADPVVVDTAASVSATFTDAGQLDTHSASVDWGDGSVTAATVTGSLGSGSITGSHAYAAAGFYIATVTLTDKDGAASTATYETIIVIDPKDSAVSGKASLDMPDGNADLDIKVDYRTNTLTGDVAFDIKGANLLFESTGFDWLVVSGAKATLKGSGTINGAGNYELMLVAIDSGARGRPTPDLVRIRIIDKGNGTVVYDNQPGDADSADPTTPVSSGRINVR